MRLVRNEVLPEAMFPTNYVANGTTYSIKSSGTDVYWNKGDKNNNDWATAGLQYYLNTEQDEEGSNKGYMSYLSEATKSLLEERTHYLGTYMMDTDTAVSGYQHERDVLSCEGGIGAASSFPTEGCNVWSGNQATWKGSVALMYPSDYGFSADKSNWTETEIFNYDGEAKDTSWMFTTMPDAQSKNSWMLAPSFGYSGIAMYWGIGGYVDGGDVDDGYGARPVLNMKSDVKITNIETADGTIDKPYELGL